MAGHTKIDPSEEKLEGAAKVVDIKSGDKIAHFPFPGHMTKPAGDRD